MKFNRGFLFLMISGSLFLGSCRAGKENSSQNADIPVIQTKPMIKGNDEMRAVLHATVFRMNGDYADKVAVSLNQDGSLAYYPDPSDISEQSAPKAIGNGWYLNLQGIGPQSKFTSYTFEEYRNLKQPPTHKELLESIIPEASVTEFIELPFTTSEALENPGKCFQYIPVQ